MKQQILIAGLFALSLGFALPSQATETNMGGRIITGIGNVIVAQGNNALRQMREDIKKNLTSTLKPLLPAPASAKAESQAARQ